MEGYLFKRTSNAFKSWVRRWFTIENNQLVYRKRTKDSLTVMEEDLRLCTVRPLVEIERRFCFEVLSPSRSHILQADSEADYHAWMNAIQAGVSTAYNNHQSVDKAPDGHSDTQSGDSSASGDSQAKVQAALPPSYESEKFSRMSQILSVAGNSECCDCGSGEPRWASINLGITLCIECSGIHRSFGVHMSKVRSLTLDSWEQELLKVMLELGNSVINQIYEANVDENAFKRATPHCNREVREAWIRAKYIDRAFVRKLPRPEDHEKPSSPKTWSVKKWKRRSSPSKTTESPSPGATGTPSAGDAPAMEEKGTLLEGQSQDSGLGGSTQDVIVFGTTATEHPVTTPTGEDEDSMSEPETDPDTQSTTSYEDFSKLHPDMLLYKAARARNLPVMREALALGADPNWQNEEEHHQTPLMKAIASGSMVPLEFLLINGAKLDTKDDRGQSALHHATLLGHTGQVCQLLKRNANQQAVDENGRDPLSIAISEANADIVTILRLSKLNQEMKETEGMYGIQGDETFNEVFRDFTSMAHNAPEKLNRNK
ncbi:hypothetical protein NP493_518g01000 [Ridgeia piscesae]|uniref:Arf-GAP with coiled-coil, ANK repeat and PH domain-containing protein 2 n=1 Tax=Ridgeia piscesae TaxID=27915 RepID=A0AAD9KX77_RIDPI|nr:hypothetical protein NP493_518g01000 [Ridgeia piscesae]